MMESDSVTAYFQLIQGNVQHIASGNADAVRSEAEQRHREIMQSTIHTLGTQCRQAIDQMKKQKVHVCCQNFYSLNYL